MTRRVPVLLAVLGWVLVAAGIGTFWWANRTGWTAYTASYAPLQPGESVPVLFYGDGTFLWTLGHVVGAGLVVLGLLLFAGLTGWALGRRRSPTTGR